MTQAPIDYAIIIESYNLKEGTSHDRFREILQAATDMTKQDGNGEVLIADSYGSPALAELLQKDFPNIRHVIAEGDTYDEAKAKAAEAARGKFVLFLDGDCIPEPGWQHHLLQGLRSGEVGCGGYTRYEGKFLAALMSIMDFGFFYPKKSRPLKCYASNNSGFRKTLLQECPVPEGDLRCRCYFHAQQLWRRGTPVKFVPEAQVLHELPPVVRERTRQGYDMVASAWADSELPQARWTKWGWLSAPLFYGMSVWLDTKRMFSGYRDLGLSPVGLVGSLPLFPLFRLLDLGGIMRALTRGPEEEGWGGMSWGSSDDDH